MRKPTARRNACDLHVHSTFSIFDGFGSPESVVRRAVELNWGAVALTEHGWLGSAPQLYQLAKATKWKNGDKKPVLKPIIGCEFYVVPHDILGKREKEYRSSSYHLTVLALTAEGYKNIVAWNNLGMERENFYYKPRISVEAMVDIAPYPLHHNVVLSGCLGGELCQAILNLNGTGLFAGISYVEAMKVVFPHFYIEIQNHSHDKFMGKGFERYEAMVAAQVAATTRLVEIAEATRTPVVLTNDSHFQRPDQRKAHVAMVTSKMNRWSKEDTHMGSHQDSLVGEHVRQYAYWRSYMQAMEPLAARTPGCERAIANIHEIVEAVDIRLDPLDKGDYSIPFSGYNDPIDKLRRRGKSRLISLVKKHGPVARERFEHELRSMGDFAHYLLFMSDFIRWAGTTGILTEVRGSANNSLLCYCIGIHDIDPIAYKLTFERFVNPERKKLPDIDIDIDAEKYPEFMEYVKAYIEEREGEGNIRLICNYGTLANRSTFRLVAESLGVPKETQDDIADLLPQMIDSGMVSEEDDVYGVLREQYPEIYEIAADVFDNVKNVSQHAGGWLFGTRDRPLDEWIPKYHISSSGELVTQYDYKTALAFGLNKGDFLRQKYLTVIRKCLTMLGKDPMDMHQIPLDDEATFEMIRRGDTEGVFTIQGSTNRNGVMEVEVEDVHGIIAAIAIYRPALTRQGLHHTYNKRRKGDEPVEHINEYDKGVLDETFGLPIFQEQTMEIGYAVGMDHLEVQQLLDAIKLAKGVGRGAAEAFEKLKPTFMARACQVMSEEDAERIFHEKIEPFQGYGFNRGHSTGYGIRSDRAAYLKCHHPKEFWTALLDTYGEVPKYIAGAKRDGFSFQPPLINEAGIGFTPGQGQSIRIGFGQVKGVGPVACRALVKGQPYSSLDDLRERTPTSAVKANQIEALAKVGAFQTFGIKQTVDDAELFQLLGFLPHRPKAMAGINPSGRAHTSQSGWRHSGYTKGVELSDGRESVSKLFWIPNMPDNDKWKLLDLQASPWARAKSYLLTAIDENGIPFHIKAGEDKEVAVDTLKFIAKQCRGSAILMNGSIRLPFVKNGPLSFTFYDVAGADREEPKVWHLDEKWQRAFVILSRRKRRK